MIEDLPDLFARLERYRAPVQLRSRVLAAVEHELTRGRKPRWERVAQWSVAATFLLGVGLNAWQFTAQPTPGVPRPTAQQTEAWLEQLASGESTPRDASTRRPVPGPFDAHYARLLEKLLKQPSG
jgi:hypothetical protein